MGIINLTPDSFSDGGALPSLAAALAHAEHLVRAGAACLDVGGESTRPGATAVAEVTELARVMPFLQAARGRWPVPLSIDTRNPAVAAAALAAGVQIVNDVSGLADPEMAALVASSQAVVILMHSPAAGLTLRSETAKALEPVTEIITAMAALRDRALAAGIPRQHIWLDPGLGFGKDLQLNLALLAALPALRALGQPLVLGPSRKRFLGALVGGPPQARDAATAATCAVAAAAGVALLRVHNVAAVRDALTVGGAIAAAAGHRPSC